MSNEIRPITRALLSVSDKTGIVEFAKALAAKGVEILSTGGTAKLLADSGVKVKEVSEHTGFPEMLDGRVKTLHPKIHGGILGIRENKEHASAMQAHGIAPIDLVVVNLYPFEQTVAKWKGDVSAKAQEDIIENIDIGGPAMIRAAAKNHHDVAVVVDAQDYAAVLEEVSAHGGTTFSLRERLAGIAYARTGAYDAAIGQWFARVQNDAAPRRFAVAGELKQTLRYGENPHQQAAFYVNDPSAKGLATAKQLQGKELSYNNINDTDAAWALVSEFEETAVVIVKHANPCGVALGKTPLEAYRKAHACDPESAFGGIVALNRSLDAETAKAIAEIFVEVVIAPEASAEAEAVFAAKKNLRLLVTGGMPQKSEARPIMKIVSGGFLLQDEDVPLWSESELKTVTKKSVEKALMQDLRFAFTVAKHVKSNAIVFAKDGASIGIGAGQMSRVNSVRIAGWKAKEAGLSTQGAVLASDAFFPFPDNIQWAKELGIAAIVQPGGSIRDAEVIAAADEAGIAMLFTGMRHFRH